MNILSLVLAAVIATGAPAGAAGVSVAKSKLPDGRHVLTHEIIVDASVEQVWAAISTAEGWKTWAVPVAWETADDILETSYDKSAKPNDRTTIRQQILYRAPHRLMLFRTIKAPEGFPDFATYSKVTSLFELEPTGEGTRVRLSGSGYADTDSGRKLLGFFEKGNATSLEQLRASFGAAVPAAPLIPGLQPLSFLVGHCWRGDFAARKQVDTHCFESVYGGKHIRDRHEVTGGKEVYRGETVYSWNRELGRVDYTYWNSLGGVSRGTMVPKGHALDFGNETYTRPDGAKMTISTVWRRNGNDAYDTVSATTGVTGQRIVTYRRVD